MNVLKYAFGAGHLVFFLCLGLLLPLLAACQQGQLPSTPLPLADLSQFTPVAANWQIVGDMFFDRQKLKKRKTTAGKGVLVNLPTDKMRDNLLTTLEHGDMELELEYMMAPGSNSGVYLQGRYEVQLFDSWGVQNPTYSDAGGIYERWDDSRPEGQKGYQGHPPRVNASRAPGLWQHYRIVFKAPRFNEQGHKTANARFVQVILNGVMIHENVEVTGPTRAAAFTDEKPMGPLMLQGDHGPVAFRNIRYKTYGLDQVHLQDLQYRAYEGPFDQLPDFAGLTPSKQGESEVLMHQIGQSANNFAGQYTGVMKVPAKGTYLFELNLDWVSSDPHFINQQTGGGRLTIGDKVAVEHKGQSKSVTGQVALEAGEHPFTLAYFKNQGDRGHSFTLYSEGPGIERQKLNAPAAEAPWSPPGAITVSAQGEPVVLRSFLNHNGKKRTHCVLVADPDGAHYSLDLRQGALLHIWKGNFAETTAMWHSRGESQVATPLGSVIELRGQPSVARLQSKDAAWPDSASQGPAGYRFNGYRLDQQGRPTFSYQLGNLEVKERLASGEQGRRLQHELVFSGSGDEPNLWCRLAEGSKIVRLRDGSYSINDKQYYVVVPKAKEVQPVIRKVQGREELVVPVQMHDNQASVSYSIVW